MTRRTRCSLLQAVTAADRFDVFGEDLDEADLGFRSSLPRPSAGAR